jgi:F0F1-type ATP synthase assembly protein I
MTDEKKPQKSSLAQYLRHTHAGLEFAVAIALFTLGGVWLDRRLGTKAVFTILGLAIGFGGGFRALYLSIYGRPGKDASTDERQSRPDGIQSSAKQGSHEERSNLPGSTGVDAPGSRVSREVHSQETVDQERAQRNRSDPVDVPSAGLGGDGSLDLESHQRGTGTGRESAGSETEPS